MIRWDEMPFRDGVRLERVDGADDIELTERQKQIMAEIYEDDEQRRFELAVRATTEEIAELLIDKNRQYGNAALDPLRIFARDVPVSAQLDVRLDDKLSRIKRGVDDMDPEDVEKDIIGYLILRRIARLGRMEPGAVSELADVIAATRLNPTFDETELRKG